MGQQRTFSPGVFADVMIPNSDGGSILEELIQVRERLQKAIDAVDTAIDALDDVP